MGGVRGSIWVLLERSHATSSWWSLMSDSLIRVGTTVENTAPKHIFSMGISSATILWVKAACDRVSLYVRRRGFWRCQQYYCGSCSFVPTHAVTERQTGGHCSDLMPTLIGFQRIKAGLKIGKQRNCSTNISKHQCIIIRYPKEQCRIYFAN